MLRYILPVAVFGALVAFFYFGLGRDQQTLPSPLIGKPVPVFELPRLDDPSKKVSNREHLSTNRSPFHTDDRGRGEDAAAAVARAAGAE